MKNTYLVLGCGKVGKAISFSLKKKKKNVYLWDRDFEKAKKFCFKNKIKVIKNLKEFKGNFIIISINDDFIFELAKKLSKEIDGKGIAIHTSGIYNENILLPLKEKGWEIGKCHPIYTFPPKETKIPNGLTYGIQGNLKAIKKIENFIKIFKGRPLIIPKGMEEIYHLALSFGSNFSSYFFYISLKIFKENFKEKNALSKLFHQTVENILNYEEKGITGPHIRGDKKTIKKHIKIIKERYPEILRTYNLLNKNIYGLNLLQGIINVKPSGGK